MRHRIRHVTVLAGAGVGGDVRLLEEVHAVDEAGGLDERAQLGLAPHPAGGVVAQRGRERLRRRAQSLFRLGGAPELLGELAVLPAALGLELGDLLLHRSERLLHRAQRLQHAALGLVRLFALLRVVSAALDDLAVLRLRRNQLLAQRFERRLRRREPSFDLRSRGRLVLPQLGHGGGVLSLDEPRIGIRDPARPA